MTPLAVGIEAIFAGIVILIWVISAVAGGAKKRQRPGGPTSPKSEGMLDRIRRQAEEALRQMDMPDRQLPPYQPPSEPPRETSYRDTPFGQPLPPPLPSRQVPVPKGGNPQINRWHRQQAEERRHAEQQKREAMERQKRQQAKKQQKLKKPRQPAPPPLPAVHRPMPVEVSREGPTSPIYTASLDAPEPARPTPAVNAVALHKWLTPATLRQQFILTEIFQPPLSQRQTM